MDFDILIRGGDVIDGTESARAFRADVGIAGDAIRSVADLSKASAPRVIDATGKTVAPGFIDMHTHSDFSSLETPTADSKVLCGVTTEVFGQCGGSPFPLRGEAFERRSAAYEMGRLKITWRDVDGYVEVAEKIGCSVNRALMVGHNMIRGSVMGYSIRQPSRDELRSMVREVEEAIDKGVFGLTTGLIYPPGCYAKTEEIVELCRPVAAAGALYSSHMRDEGDRLEAAIDEILDIHARSGAAVHMSHLKCCKRRNWHKIDWLKRRLFEARDAGLDFTADRYPYIASSTGLDSMLPDWSYEGTELDKLNRLKDPAVREKIRADVMRSYPEEADWDSAMVSHCDTTRNRAWEGKRVTEIAREMGREPFDALCEILLADGGRTGAVFFNMKEENLEEILSWPFVMIGSDSSARNARTAKGKPHPRCYGTSARVLGRYARERRVLTLEQAVWKLAGFPAKRLGLADRGTIAEGKKADLTVFDPATVVDRATYENPHQYSAGIEQVIVNGVLTVDKGQHLGKLAGRIVKRK